jgi:CTP:molybdopterin cytidylyltransferase MocA
MMTICDIDIKYVVRHHTDVRTTLSIDDDILAIVTRQAKLRGQSLGKTVSDLVRRGLSAPTPSQDEDGLVVFQLPADSPAVTTEDVRRIEAEGA